MTPLSHPLFDARREMSLKEWLGVSTFYDGYLYQGDFIAHVLALRCDSKSAPLETAVYLISVNLMCLDQWLRLPACLCRYMAWSASASSASIPV